ncbi:zinc-ribbon domain-containing protein [Porcincola sp. LCP21S3_C12]
MAMIKCTECGHTVSDKANACPECGCPVSEILHVGIRHR